MSSSACAIRTQSWNLASAPRRARRNAAATVAAQDQQRQEKEAKFTEVISGCDERILRLALRITRNREDAEDARQETMLKVHRNLPQFEGRSRFTTWVSRIAINESLMALRKRRDRVNVPLEEAHPQAEATSVAERWHSTIEGPEAAYSRRETRTLLWNAISDLGSRPRLVFLLRTVEELSTKETAKALGISGSAVKAHLRRARNQLRRSLEPAVAERRGKEIMMPIPASAKDDGAVAELLQTSLA